MTWALTLDKLRDLVEAATPTLRAAEPFHHSHKIPKVEERLHFRNFTLRHVGGSINMDAQSAVQRRVYRDVDLAVYYPAAADDYAQDGLIGQDYEDISDALLECGDYATSTTGLVDVAPNREGLPFDIEDNDDGARILTMRVAVESY